MTILAYAKPTRCLACDAPLTRYLDNVEDRVYGLRGSWSFTHCTGPGCAVIYLDHDLTAAQLTGFYAGYSTHAPPVIEATGLKRLYRRALADVRHRRLGYSAQDGFLPRLAGSLLARIPFFRETAFARVFWLRARPGGRVLEVGFGNGQGLVHLREAGWDVTGCEFDDICIAQARALGFTVREGGLTEAGFAPATFDAVVASHTIEHVPDAMAFVAEAFRVLKPGGTLVLATPNAASRDAVRFGRDWRGLEAPRHLSIHTPGSLRRMAHRAGFEHVRLFGTPLGGFILQQSRELRRHRKPSAHQGVKTWRYNLLASLIDVLGDLQSEEIVLCAQKSD